MASPRPQHLGQLRMNPGPALRRQTVARGHGWPDDATRSASVRNTPPAAALSGSHICIAPKARCCKHSPICHDRSQMAQAGLTTIGSICAYAGLISLLLAMQGCRRPEDSATIHRESVLEGLHAESHHGRPMAGHPHRFHAQLRRAKHVSPWARSLLLSLCAMGAGDNRHDPPSPACVAAGLVRPEGMCRRDAAGGCRGGATWEAGADRTLCAASRNDQAIEEALAKIPVLR